MLSFQRYRKCRNLYQRSFSSSLGSGNFNFKTETNKFLCLEPDSNGDFTCPIL